MTAQVAVLNTQGIAIASDSAVTVTGGERERSYTSADKIFPVKGVPVAVLHSSRVQTWGVPWQLLVEAWGQQRAPEQLATLDGYAAEFRDWLLHRSGVVTPEEQDGFLRWIFRDYLMALRNRIRSELSTLGIAPEVGYAEGEVAQMVDRVVDSYVSTLKERDTFSCMEGADAKGLCSRLAGELREDLDWVFDDTQRTAHLDGTAQRIGELLVTTAEPFTSDATRGFVGFGRDSFFSGIYRVTISGALAGVVRYYDESEDHVSTTRRVSIAPLGMTDAMAGAFLRGTSQEYRYAAHRVLASCVEAKEGPGGDEASNAAHTQLDEEFDELEWEQFLSPLDIVGFCP